VSKECSEVLEESATGSGQCFWKSFKKSFKIRIPLQNTLQDELYAADTSGTYCTGEEENEKSAGVSEISSSVLKNTGLRLASSSGNLLPVILGMKGMPEDRRGC
jgi:hypothetical protein